MVLITSSLTGGKAELLAVPLADRIVDLQVVLLLNVNRSHDPPAWVAASFSQVLLLFAYSVGRSLRYGVCFISGSVRPLGPSDFI